MDLVTSESLGYLPADLNEQSIPLVIPNTAPLITGKRAVVYVAVKDQPGIFEGRVVELGPRAGDQYIVNSGLREGELVVTHGAFKIDSAVQIQAKPSMMNPEEGQGAESEGRGVPARVTFDAPVAFQQQLRDVAEAYLPVADALSHDNFDEAKAALPAVKSAATAVDMASLQGEAHTAWMEDLKLIQSGIQGIEAAEDIKAARAAFEDLSNGLIAAADSFGLAGESPVYVYHCPMAFGNKGADWLQNKQGTENPYFGSSMFTCGEELRIITSRAGNQNPAGSERASDDEPAPQHNH